MADNEDSHIKFSYSSNHAILPLWGLEAQSLQFLFYGLTRPCALVVVRNSIKSILSIIKTTIIKTTNFADLMCTLHVMS